MQFRKRHLFRNVTLNLDLDLSYIIFAIIQRRQMFRQNIPILQEQTDGFNGDI